MSAQDMFSRGRKSWRAAMIFAPPWTFFQRLVFQLGVLDGWRGWLIAWLSGTYIYLKVSQTGPSAGGREHSRAAPGPIPARPERAPSHRRPGQRFSRRTASGVAPLARTFRARARSGADCDSRFRAGAARERCGHLRARSFFRLPAAGRGVEYSSAGDASKGVDVVHANEPHALSAAWLARAHRSRPRVVSRRIALPLSSGFISRARYRAAARIVAVSHFVEQSMIASGLPAGTIEVVYDGVEIPPEISIANREIARAQFGISQEAFCIGNVAAFVPEKGHAFLLRAFAELRVILGTGIANAIAGKNSRMRPALPRRRPGTFRAAELARQLQIPEAVKFLPPNTDIETMFAAMDIFAFPVARRTPRQRVARRHGTRRPLRGAGRGGVPEIIESEKMVSSSTISTQMNSPPPSASAIKSGSCAPNGRSRPQRRLPTRFSADHMVESNDSCCYELTVSE